MSFTPEELAEMARADAEIEREFILTAEEAAESRELDRAAKMERKDKKAKALAEYQRRYRETNKEALAERKRRYYEANKEAVAEYHRRYYEANKAKWRDYYAKQKAKKAAALMQQDSGQPEDPATNASQV
uniref:Uncharacterized protein n=1 Tax=Podoviridae sp. ctZih56 TaxID=2827741 RepID=A0A8S5SFC2_9CAUD|nr:MAG TPA: hypothetical protein [Podoviridae sp. ctZih56]